MPESEASEAEEEEEEEEDSPATSGVVGEATPGRHRGWKSSVSSLRFHKGGHASEHLGELSDRSLQEQAEQWRRLADDLGPFIYSDPRTEWDAVARFFDGTTRGVRFIFDRLLARRETVDRDFLRSLLADNFGFLAGVEKDKEAASQRDGLSRFCDLVLTADNLDGMKQSFEIAIRSLRIGSLLDAPRQSTRWLLYVYDYEDASITGSFRPSVRKQSRFKGNRWVDAPVVAAQVPCGQPGSGFGSVDEFLVSDPWVRSGHVRWVHSTRPCLECLLALGQQYHLRVHAQCLLSRLDGAQSQVEISSEGRDWSSVVFPAAYIDRNSKRSFEQYQAWYHRTAHEAKVSGYSGLKLDREKKRSMPALKLGVVHVNLMVFWSRTEDSTVISVASEPTYLARWQTLDGRKSSGWWAALSGCCRRATARRRADGYQALPGDEEADDDTFCDEEELDDDDQIQRMFKQFELTAEAEETTHFEDTFEGVLLQLSEPNSVLRMGSHTQLVFRILLNRSADYLHIIRMYTVAVNNLQELLNSSEYGDKDQVITRVSAAKRELESLLRMVQPFVDNVLPQLRSASTHAGGEPEALHQRVCRHHKFDMENNFTQFLQECRAQITLCESLLSDYDRKSQDKVNNILNFLTMITFLIMPMQILTGLYGMNFRFMPELRWGYGYHYFFLLSVSGTVTFALILYCLFRGRSH